MIIGFFVSPLGLYFKLSSAFSVDWKEFYWVFTNSSIQAFGSTIGAMTLGLFMAFGIQKTSIRFHSTLKTLCLLPSLLPSLVTILIFLSLLDPFPYGLTGIILVQSFIYSGFFAIIWTDFQNEHLSSLAMVAAGLGASRFFFWRKVFGFSLQGLASSGLLVFLICFTSLSIPLAIGGGKGTTLEVLIFEKVRFSQDWGQAILLSAIQSLIFFGFLFFRNRKPHQSGSTSVENAHRAKKYFSSLFGLIALGVYFFIFFIGLWGTTISGWSQVIQMKDFVGEIIWASLLSLGIGFSFGSLILGFLLFLSSIYDQKFVFLFFRYFNHPSISLVGFLGMSSGIVYHLPWICYLLGSLMIFGPSLLKWNFFELTEKIQPQIRCARSLGASRWFIFKKIVLPQMVQTLAFLSGLGAVWAMGDFAFSKLVFAQNSHLALVIFQLMSSYRIESALFLVNLMLVLMSFVFASFVLAGTFVKNSKQMQNLEY